MHDITKGKIFGTVDAHIHVIEFQKRGLPHAHVLLILAKEDKIRLDNFDKYVSAEIPDKDLHPEAYETVTKCMMHDACGPLNPNAKCMDKEKNVCTKNFPKEFNQETTFGRK
jgi:hypothetical protein